MTTIEKLAAERDAYKELAAALDNWVSKILSKSCLKKLSKAIDRVVLAREKICELSWDVKDNELICITTEEELEKHVGR